MKNALLDRYQTRVDHFAHGAFAVNVVLPRSPEDLIDVSEFNEDERLPYWAELWPSACSLTRHLLDLPTPDGRVLELGCGVALPSLALRWRGVEVLATDYYQDALDFARFNAELNTIPPPDTALLDWRELPHGFGGFELVVAADVLYERRNVDALVALLPIVSGPRTRVLIADPGRAYAGDFREAMAGLGWSVADLASYDERAPAGERSRSRVTIIELRPGA